MAMEPPRRIGWIPKNGGSAHQFAVVGGIDSRRNVYVARGFHIGGVIPGKLHDGHKCAYISYGGKEFAKDDYDILIAPPNTVSWVEAEGGNVPPNAIDCGFDPGGEKHYIGRVAHKGTVTVGKVHPQHGLCYIPYGGLEHKYHKYEVLCRNMLAKALNA